METKIKWIDAKKELPQENKKNIGGYSDKVIVHVRCRNELEFVDVDVYDPYSKSWEKYDYSGGAYEVIQWGEMPMPNSIKKT